MLVASFLFFAALPLQEEGTVPTPKDPWQLLLSKYDADGDGRVTEKEYPRGKVHFGNLDRNRDGVLTGSDFEGSGRRRPSGRREGGGYRSEKAPPKVGAMAPDFELPRVPGTGPPPPETGESDEGGEGAEEDFGKKDPPLPPIRLSSFRGDMPVALIFGSYT